MDGDNATDELDDWSLAELVILSTTQSADQIIEAVGSPPDRSWNRGDPKKTRGLVEKFSGAAYTSRAPRTARPEDHLDDLLGRLAPVADRVALLAARLTDLDGRPDPIRIWVTHFTGNASPGYDFSPRQIARVAAFGTWFGVSVDVYDAESADAGVQSKPGIPVAPAAVGATAGPLTGHP